MLRGTPPRMLWHSWEKPAGRAAAWAEARALALIDLCALAWTEKPVCYAVLPLTLAEEMIRWRFCLRYRTLGCAHAWLEHLAAGAALVALWLYMDIRHGRKGFRAGAHRALMAAVTFCALAWTLRAGILTGQITG